MPRRTRPARAGRDHAPPRFNEAGAKCPGEQDFFTGRVLRRLAASMRPGRNAPENPRRVGVSVQAAIRASMRPGRNAPENRGRRPATGTAGSCFNEAGAKCPGELRRAALRVAQADVASMRPGRNAPENSGEGGFMGVPMGSLQ